MFNSSKLIRGGALAVSILAALPLVAAGAQANESDQGAFTGMAGSWSGDGTIVMTDGSKEKIRCRATYSVPPMGAALNQGLRCASDSYQFDVKSYVQADEGGMLSGTWSEAVHGVTGDVTGRVQGGQISTSVDTLGFSAQLLVSTRGGRQNVSIRPQGGDVQSVTIELRKI